MSVRITGLQEVATLQNGDYIAIDNESNGTHKFDAMKMGANMASNIAPAYSTAATYAIGDFCMHDGILYKCTTAISTPESWTASHWTQTSAGVALAQKVDKVSGKGLSQNDFTNTLKTKLDGIASGAEVNVQANWAQTNTSADDYIKNKPVNATSSVGGLMSASDKAKLDGIASGAEVNVQANWTETNTSSDAYIKNKPTNATTSTAGLMSASDKTKLNGIASGAEVNVQADWSQTNTSADDYIKNKPVDATSSVGGLMSATDKAKLDSIEQGAEVNVQADWSQTNTSADDYIKNKPTNATTSTAGLMSASDKTKLNGIETGAQVNVIDGVKVDGTLLTVDGNKDVDIVGKANQTSLAPQYSSDTGNYVRGNYVIYQNNLYKCLQDTSGVWDATKWEQVDIGTDLEEKANIDGLYEEMTVGGAEQLISDTFNIESVPYNFRTSGGSLDIGDRETDKLIGGTVVWNQLVADCSFTRTSNGITAVTDYNDGTVTLNGTATANAVFVVTQDGSGNGFLPITNHKYLIKGGLSSDIYVQLTSVTNWNNLNPQDVGAGKIANCSASSPAFSAAVVLVKSGVTVTNQKVIPQLFDLTALFGTTIADYIYSLEQNTEGAGVAFFKKLFPAPYYAYNAGQLMSVNAGSHVMNGFNQWDEEWEVGSIDASTGQPSISTTRIRSKNFCKILPNTNYYVRFSLSGNDLLLYYYDANKNYISCTAWLYNGVINTPENAYYFKIGTDGTYGSTYNNDICINIAWDGERNGEYEPYVSHTYELDDTLELRGLPKLDENNQLYYDGDVYESDGTVTRKYEEIALDPTWDWLDYSGYTGVIYRNNVFPSEPKNIASYNSGLSNTLKCVPNVLPTSVGYGCFATSTAGVKKNLYIRCPEGVADASAFKTWLASHPTSIVYELATPTTESATPYTNPQIVNDWGTETYTDYSYDAQTRDVQIPVGHETRYMANLKAKLEMAPESPNGDGDYIVRQTSGENAYVAIGSSPTIQHKAEIDGTYDDMNVGGAKQLLSNVFEEDQVPYTFRTSGGSIDIGDREYDTVVGGTIAWNQLLQNGDFASTSGWSKSNCTISASNNILSITASANVTAQCYKMLSIPIGHKALSIATIKADKSQTVSLRFGSNFATKSLVADTWTAFASINQTSNASTEYNFYFSTTDSVQVDVKNAMCIDLTQMFGSTIADYIYSLEQATVGAGVAWFKNLFPKPYYEYNAGELLSVEGVSSHDMTGFNQWDEEWELGGLYYGTGLPYDATDRIRSKYFKCLPSTTYYWMCKERITFTIFEYDANNTMITRLLNVTSTGGAFTTSNNAKYLRFYLEPAYGTIYNHDICINLHWDGERDGEYESYVKHTYALDDSLTLRGIPKLDASNNLYYDGDTYESDGTVTRKYGIVDLGSLTWIFQGTSTYVFYASVDNMFKPTTYTGRQEGIMSSEYVPSDNTLVGSGMGDKTMLRYDGNIYIRDTAYSSASSFKTAMSGVYLVYELATPTTETADPYQSPQIVDDWGTEEYVTTSIVPVGHDTKYTANLRAKIEMAPDSPSGDGDYIVRQADGTNSYVPLVIPNELPTMPTTDGNWVLRCTVSSGTATLSWVSAT